MIIKEKNRSEIESIFKWKLETIYETNQAWEEEYKKVVQMIKGIDAHRGHLLDSASNLLSFVTLDDEISIGLNKLYVYAKMRSDEDMNNSLYQTMVGKMDNLNTEYAVAVSFVIPELLKSDFDKVQTYIDELQELKKYAFHLKSIYKLKDHYLSDKEESLLSQFNVVLSSASDTASLLRNADLSFDVIKDEKGNEVELSNANYIRFMSSINRDVRHDAFKAMYKTYGNIKNTLASTLSAEINKNYLYSKVRHYNSALEMALNGNNIPMEIYDNLIKTIGDNLTPLYDYYKLKKDVLKLDEIHMYDIYADLISESDIEYSYDDAKKMIMDSLSVLGSDYINDLKQAFDQGWIDVYHNKGKKSGAYSWGSYGTNPFILLNYQGKLEDVSTLAHELGHSMHSYYAQKNNPYVNANYEIFVAEVASTVNEMLFYNYMLKNSNNKEEKLTILNKLLELFKGTIYRQTMFAEFEKNLYEHVEHGEILTEEKISNLYYELNKKYFGEDFVIDKEIAYEWMRIPHFYTYYYVYQYATGLSAACFITKEILSGNKDAVKNYLEFLKSGGSNYPTELLKIAGVDITRKEVIESAIDMFKETIKEFKDLI